MTARLFYWIVALVLLVAIAAVEPIAALFGTGWAMLGYSLALADR